MGGEGLSKDERACGRDLVGRLFNEGGMGVSGVVLVRVLPNPSGKARMGAVAGKKLGNAVLRNRMKRRLRAAYRTNRRCFPQGWDLFFVARRGLMEAEWPEVIRSMEKAVERAISAHTGRHRCQPRR